MPASTRPVPDAVGAVHASATPPPGIRVWERRWFPPLMIAALGMLVYRNSFETPLVFDGSHYILENKEIQHVWPWIFALGGDRALGALRPFGFLTFALNYAVGGYEVWGYHAVNLAIHVAAAWLLFDIVRRTLARGRLAARFGAHAGGLALAVALLWLVHPLQTNAVTYVYQRLESLMGLCYLATLWCFLRALDAPKRGGWFAASVVCCALGMATKEVMVTAPLIVLWYDRAFAASSWREIVRQRGKYYAALAGTWGVLAWLMFSSRDVYAVGGALVVSGLSPLEYAQSQPGVILHYLRLVFWPDQLCLNYGWPVARTAAEIVPPALAIGALVALTAWSACRWPELGFLGAWFFVILAPSSSIVPIKDLAFEHRMYLPLASVAVLVVLAVDGMWHRFPWSSPDASPWLRALPTAALAVALAALGGCTVLRNQDYDSALKIWEDAARKRPDNVYNHYGLAVEKARLGDFSGGVSEATVAINLKPDYGPPYITRGYALQQMGQYREAMSDYQRAIDLGHDLIAAYNNRGACYKYLGEYDLAVKDYDRAIEIDPYNQIGYFKRGQAYQSMKNRYDQAIRDYTRAIELQPGFAEAYNDRGACYQRTRRYDKAQADYATAIQLKPDFVAAYSNRALSYFIAGKYDSAWADVRTLRKLGGHPDPRFLQMLTEASGRGE